jgi:hypothetical protein
MVPITVHCPLCQSDALVRNGHAPNGKQLYRCRACGRQSREKPTPHALCRNAPRGDPACKRKNAAVCAASRAPLGSLAPPYPIGSKKRSLASSLTDHPACTGSRRSRFYDPGTGRALVVCAQKSIRLLDLGCPLPQDTTGGRLCRG